MLCQGRNPQCGPCLPAHLPGKRRRIPHQATCGPARRDPHCITWYNWALHETPRYEAASRVNPGLADAHWVMLATKSLESLMSEAYDRRLGRHPDPEGRIVAVAHHTRCDDTRAPAGKHTCITEQPTVPAGRMAERDASHQPWPHGQPDGGGRRAGTRRQAAAHSGVRSIPNPDSRPLRHRLSLGDNQQQRLRSGLYLLQGHRRGHGSPQAVGGERAKLLTAGHHPRAQAASPLNNRSANSTWQPQKTSTAASR